MTSDFFIGLVVGVFVAGALLYSYISHSLNTVLLQVRREIKDEFGDIAVAFRVEKHNDTFLFYNADTGDFILQANSMEEMKELFAKLFPNKLCYITEGDERVLSELKESFPDD